MELSSLKLKTLIFQQESCKARNTNKKKKKKKKKKKISSQEISYSSPKKCLLTFRDGC